MTSKKFYMVLDTETASTACIPFDIAYTIINRAGNVIAQKNYLVADVFNSPIGQHLLMHDDFSKNKMSEYVRLMREGVSPVSFAVIREEMRQTIREYNCTVVAYNAKFDYESLTNFAQSFGFDNFFEDSTPVWDLWNIALTVLADSNNYVKFCKTNNYASDKGNLKSSAEVMYRYLTQDTDFMEAHTALSDTEIEAAIMIACLKRHKKMETDFVKQVFNHPVWRERLQAA